ncbi:hypothetical protein K2173_000556 [Erythroxylum novogranatense]|uniref:RRM domain-containing protein n=1 Tax=Erythroxylum novogranatense TaxID=1862640 RepID=A0AAV8S7Y1_9ROSI|nr:hypothetical protein K2173_000556 [Erythroxylum novogranatense]
MSMRAGAGLGGGGGGRERSRRDLPSSRFEEGGVTSKRGNNPPSRHLWIGNLFHSISENDLTDQFIRFGELDSVAFQAGRSYAFINFMNHEDAIDAMKALQGFPLAGNPLRIEFAKADKSTPSRGEDYVQRGDEQRSTLRGSPFSQRDFRMHDASPDSFYPDKSKISERSTEPSEVLWIGFPALLKVDEMILRKAFSPFGEIEKITVFPGRSYAFVRFRSVLVACRAKETLQGKLFGNPRVHICFAKNEAGSSSSGRTTCSPYLKPNGRPGGSETFQQDRSFGDSNADPGLRYHLMNLEAGESDMYGFNRKDAIYPAGGDTFDDWRFEEELGPPPDVYESRGSPPRSSSAHFHESSQKFPKKDHFLEEPWDLPEDSHPFHETKRLKTGSFPPDKELPEYALSDIEPEKQVFPRAFSDFPQPEAFDKNYETRSFGYNPVSERPINLSLPHRERTDRWKASLDNFQVSDVSLPSNPIGRKRFTPEPEQPSLNLWKWEGTIAKGGTPVCHARAFPVGKVLDVMLPEFLDCTARTGLDMLAKHYYQAASAWVVFFVPASDADIGYYNEFMHYLEEKQRAAVAKLDDITTLFLVPPSDFSEKVLKVPGKLSISGVILRSEHPGSNVRPHHINEKRIANIVSFRGDLQYSKVSSSSGNLPSVRPSHDLGKSGGDPPYLVNEALTASSAPSHFVGDPYDSYEQRHEYPLHQHKLRPKWSPHHAHDPLLGDKNVPSQQSIVDDPLTHKRHSATMPRVLQENNSSDHVGRMLSNTEPRNNQFSCQETKLSVSSSMPITSLEPQQLAQLASSLLGQQRQSGNNPNASAGEDFRHKNTVYQCENQYIVAQHNQSGSGILPSQFGEMQQIQQQQQTSNVLPVVPSPVQREHQSGQGSQQMQAIGTQEEADVDPQKRLQATLQLAAALLQQIQQGKGNS